MTKLNSLLFNIFKNRINFLALFRLLVGLFPVTLQGLITLTLATLTLSVYGYGSMDLVVFAIAICALAIFIFSLFCSIISGIIVQRKVQKLLEGQVSSLANIEVEAGFPNETGFSLPAINYFPLVKLSWEISFPDFIETGIRVSDNNDLVEEIIPQKRCKTNLVIRQFTVADVLGFSRYSWRQKQKVGCFALPQKNTVKQLPLLRSLTAEDGIPNLSGDPEGDRMEIRPYVPGDSVRNIMWKVYARNRQLNVRLAEKSVYHSKRIVAYLLSSKNDEAAAAVARVALESGAFGGNWLFAADGSPEPTDDIVKALQAVAASRGIDKTHRYGLDQFLEQAAGQAGTHCIIFVAAERAAWLPALKKTLAHYNGQFSVVIATDGFADPKITSIWQKLLLRNTDGIAAESSSLSSRSEMLKLLTELKQLVESTVIVDRKTGHSFDHQLRKV